MSASIYVGFVLVATPLMGIGTADGADDELARHHDARRCGCSRLPVVLCAALSQFSAATADTVAAGGNLHTIGPAAVSGRRAYVISGIAAIGSL